MIFEFGQYRIDVDVDRTREFYNNARYISDGCECAGCRNYEKAVDSLPEEVLQFFDSLGIDMKKAAEVWAIMAENNRTVLYNGFYHFCGILLDNDTQAETCTEDSNLKLSHWNHNKTYSLSKDYHITIFDQCGYLLEEGFPSPVLEIEIEATIPWVLDEENSYVNEFERSSSATLKPSIILRLKKSIKNLLRPTRPHQ